MERAECSRNNWIVAAIAGVVVLLFVSGIGDLHWLAGLFLGGVTFGLFGATLIWLTCHDQPELFTDANNMTGTDWQRETMDRQPESLLVSGALGPDPAALQMPIVAGVMPVEPADTAAPKPAAAKAETPKPAPKAASPKPASGKKTKAAPPDDLKRIKGVGPKLSDWLHENGVTRYAQIAAWDAAMVADFAQRMGRMGGRIEADDWVGQAKLLAAGSETEFSHRVDDGEVY